MAGPGPAIRPGFDSRMASASGQGPSPALTRPGMAVSTVPPPPQSCRYHSRMLLIKSPNQGNPRRRTKVVPDLPIFRQQDDGSGLKTVCSGHLLIQAFLFLDRIAHSVVCSAWGQRTYAFAAMILEQEGFLQPTE